MATLTGFNIFVNNYVIGEDLRRNYAKSGFVADRHSDPRHRSGFEPPLSKSFGRAFIENRITAALLHGRIGYFAARGINRHNANPVTGDMVVLRLVGVHGERAANDHRFCRREGRQIVRNRSRRQGRQFRAPKNSPPWIVRNRFGYRR